MIADHASAGKSASLEAICLVKKECGRGGATRRPLAWERKAFFGDVRNVVFADTRIECVPEERFQAMLRDIDALIDPNRPK